MSRGVLDGGAEWRDAWRAIPRRHRLRISWAVQWGSAVEERNAALAAGLATRWLGYARWFPVFLGLGAVILFGFGTIFEVSPWPVNRGAAVEDPSVAPLATALAASSLTSWLSLVVVGAVFPLISRRWRRSEEANRALEPPPPPA